MKKQFSGRRISSGIFSGLRTLSGSVPSAYFQAFDPSLTVDELPISMKVKPTPSDDVDFGATSDVIFVWLT